MDTATRIIESRKGLVGGLVFGRKLEAEGGCGVLGAACSVPIAGRHFLTALLQMKNRGNGKGGGVAALGLSPERLGVSKETLQERYLLQVAYLDPTASKAVEADFIYPFLNVDSSTRLETVEDYRSIPRLDVRPPDVHRYFCRVKEDVLGRFMEENGLRDRRTAEDEFIYQNSYALNKKYYASLGEKKAFVLSHGKDMMVLKIVGWGDQVIRYYKLEDFEAHVWIGHHRYPTKGRVWHPGGAHPFVGVHEALVHNGDFSNYHSICEYLAQRNIYPLFLTDTEVAVYLFDLYSRVYGYPLEYLIEAMAPTTERDFQKLPAEKRHIYREIQTTHIHGSPDGPWFFIIGRSEDGGQQLHLLGITDTSMLRPQVFALQEGEVKIGLIASERQAIDACLRSLAAEDQRFAPKADLYWNARGGSHTDGGAFVFTVDRSIKTPQLKCLDKFGREVSVPPQNSGLHSAESASRSDPLMFQEQLFAHAGTNSIEQSLEKLQANANSSISEKIKSFELLAWLLDSLHRSGFGHRGRVRAEIETRLFATLRSFPSISDGVASPWMLANVDNSRGLSAPSLGQQRLLLDVSEFEAEGNNSAAAAIVTAYKFGWKHVISFDWRGQRFCGAGLGANSQGFRIDAFGNPGDYLGSGLDGAEIYVHTSAQDQVAQIMKAGKLVIYGDVGQTFMYAAKGGDVYVLGNAAGRPLINAVGRPRVVINGTCLDYLAESFMAGDPLNGGGFVVVNGIRFGEDGQIHGLETPYPGSNLFSLASGGAIYLRDPMGMVSVDQLNGGRLGGMGDDDWRLIAPYLKENENLFGVRLEDLLRVEGGLVEFSRIYRKVEAIPLEALGSAHVNG
jgi:glutamate synthase domain-containing protein 1/glutamate synthase domain-containing protein 3